MLCRYELLLRELRKLTPAEHEDSEQLDLSIEFMKDCNEQINKAIGAAKYRARAVVLHKLLSTRPTYAACRMPPVLPPNRSCIDHWFGCVAVTAETYVSSAVGPEIMRFVKKKREETEDFRLHKREAAGIKRHSGADRQGVSQGLAYDCCFPAAQCLVACKGRAAVLV